MAKSSSTAPGEADDPTHTHFKHKDAFFLLLEKVLAWDLFEETDGERQRVDRVLVDEIGGILDEYLSLPPLLDPHLHDIIPPLMSLLSTHIASVMNQDSYTPDSNKYVEPTSSHTPSPSRPAQPTSNLPRLHQLGRLLNWLTKVRGRKTVVAHYASELVYLSMTVEVMSWPTSSSASSPGMGMGTQKAREIVQGTEAWELRSVLLCWMGMLLTVPFDLGAFDSKASDPIISGPNTSFQPRTSQTALSILHIARPLLSHPSQEGTLSSLLLARLFAREDSSHLFPSFLDWTTSELLDTGGELVITDSNVNTTFITNVLNLLATLPGLLASPSTSPVLDQIRTFRENVIGVKVDGTRTRLEGSGSTRLRKMEVKAEGRWWVAKLGGAGGRGGEGRGRRVKGKVLGGKVDDGADEVGDEEEEDFEPPEGFEEALGRLMGDLSDRDTIVRYSAAKYISRLAILLPPSFGHQIASAVISLFESEEDDQSPSIKLGNGRTRSDGLAAGNESRWHGVCLAVAELARRGLVEGEMIGELLPWVIKALGFDIRRGAHSIGSNVRDAASYVIWSLARASSPSEIEFFAVEIAKKLVVVACYDREVGIRRAASAAFQEHVGRMGLFPHGIDVLGKTDFYSVSVRRTAFLVAAPAVACHQVYRESLLRQLHEVVLRHWDPAIRAQGAESLRLIVEGDVTDVLATEAMEAEKAYINSSDTQGIHGAVLALTQLANLFRQRDPQNKALVQIMHTLSQIRTTAFTSFGSDALLEASCDLITASATSDGIADAKALESAWRIIDLSMKSRTESVQLAAARAVGFKTARPAQKQSYAAALGEIDYAGKGDLRRGATARLLANLQLEKNGIGMDVETRRASINSLARIIQQSLSAPDEQNAHDSVRPVLEAFCKGMQDYSTDQRGDVGSWVRMAAAASSATVIQAIAETVRSTSSLDSDVERVIHGLLKQVMEKMDNVRQVAGLALEGTVVAVRGWTKSLALLEFCESFSRLLPLPWVEPETFYGLVMPLLRVELSQDAMLDGLFLSVGCKNQRTSKAAQRALAEELRSQRTASGSDEPDQLLQRISERLAGTAGENLTSNRILIPVLQTASYLSSEGYVTQAVESSAGRQSWTRLVGYAGRGLSQIKNIERITAAMALIVSAVTIEHLQAAALTHVPAVLGHPYPRIRSMSAEHLYLALQEAGQEDEELDAILLETDWTGDDFASPLTRTMELLRTL